MDGSGKIIKLKTQSSGYSGTIRGRAKGPYPSPRYTESDTDVEDVVIEELEEVEE